MVSFRILPTIIMEGLEIPKENQVRVGIRTQYHLQSIGLQWSSLQWSVPKTSYMYTWYVDIQYHLSVGTCISH